MPGYRPGVFRRRHHYRPKRRVAIRAVAAVVAEECRLRMAGTDRAVIVMPAMEPEDGYIDDGRQPFLLPGEWCREDV